MLLLPLIFNLYTPFSYIPSNFEYIYILGRISLRGGCMIDDSPQDALRSARANPEYCFCISGPSKMFLIEASSRKTALSPSSLLSGSSSSFSSDVVHLYSLREGRVDARSMEQHTVCQPCQEARRRHLPSDQGKFSTTWSRVWCEFFQSSSNSFVPLVCEGE